MVIEYLQIAVVLAQDTGAVPEGGQGGGEAWLTPNVAVAIAGVVATFLVALIVAASTLLGIRITQRNEREVRAEMWAYNARREREAELRRAYADFIGALFQFLSSHLRAEVVERHRKGFEIGDLEPYAGTVEHALEDLRRGVHLHGLAAQNAELDARAAEARVLMLDDVDLYRNDASLLAHAVLHFAWQREWGDKPKDGVDRIRETIRKVGSFALRLQNEHPILSSGGGT